MNKTIKFHPALLPDILSGRKKTTWRVCDDKEIAVGDVVDLVNKKTGRIVGHARIVRVDEKAMRDIDREDCRDHETYLSDEEMYKKFRQYYGLDIGPDTMIKIIRFALAQ